MEDFQFTQQQVIAMLHNNVQASDWYHALNDNLETYEINTLLRVAGFLAQTCHESNNYTVLRENLNYKAESLLKTFPKYFKTIEVANQYARQPEKIADRVYGGRMGNEQEGSGEGWKYRGRGILQVTGKNNYQECSMYLFNDLRLVKEPELLESDMDIAIKSACWFWTKNKLNQYSDARDMKELTRRINGGYHGLDDRLAKYDKALAILQDPALQPSEESQDVPNDFT